MTSESLDQEAFSTIPVMARLRRSCPTLVVRTHPRPVVHGRVPLEVASEVPLPERHARTLRLPVGSNLPVQR